MRKKAMDMMMDWDNYPLNYDFLSDEEKNEILGYLNSGNSWQDHLAPEKKAYANALQGRGIAARYDWAGHRGQWFLATLNDAEMEEDWRIQCSD